MAQPRVPEEYQNPFLHCRTFGHNWHVGESNAETGVFWHFVLLCDVCKTRRIDSLNRRTGAVASRRYEYPEGYQVQKGEGMPRTRYRIEFIRRIAQ